MCDGYPNLKRVSYACGEYEGNAVFVPVCIKCSRFVKPNKTIKTTSNGLAKEPNAVCTKCGPTEMLFEGFF